jgi:hypothetical protein
MGADYRYELRPDRDPSSPRAYVGSDGRVYCDWQNKRCHWTEADAVAAQHRPPLAGKAVHAYRHSCGYWHNGHPVPGES